MPFALLLYGPTTVFTLLPIREQDDTVATVQLVCIGMTSIYILMQVVVTLQEMCRQGMVDYVSNFNSIANLVLLIFLVIYVYYAASVVVDELDRDVTDNF